MSIQEDDKTSELKIMAFFSLEALFMHGVPELGYLVKQMPSYQDCSLCFRANIYLQPVFNALA